MSASVWLGVDLGEARVGLALSDPELTLAYPIGNIEVGGDYFRALDQVVDLVHERSVEEVVVGYPLLLSGQEGKSAKKASRWARNLARLLDAPPVTEGHGVRVTLRDERLTTVSAHRQLSAASVAGRQHRPRVDQQSAVVLLQSALDERAGGKEL